MKRCYRNVREGKYTQDPKKLEIQKDYFFFGVIKKNYLFITISALNYQKCFQCLSGFNWKENAIKKKKIIIHNINKSFSQTFIWWNVLMQYVYLILANGKAEIFIWPKPFLIWYSMTKTQYQVFWKWKRGWKKKKKWSHLCLKIV